jgi:hypothetical protein
MAFSSGTVSFGLPMTHVLAYLDPGSAGIILQMIAGGLAALAVSLKLFWRRILRFLRIKKTDSV